jgi:16S rRNA (uracil1498-N3)-methyltransferase
MPRFFLPPDVWQQEAWLTGDEAKHLSQVLRVRVGETVTVFDGQGRRAEAQVEEVGRDRAKLRLGRVEATPALWPEITLGIAIPKGKTMDLVVQKAVELGVSRIQPLITRRTIVQPGEGKADKWRRVALEACKQCGLDRLPTVAEPVALERWLAEERSEALALIASLAPGARPMREVLRSTHATAAIHVLVGPEGDFTPAETDAALSEEFQPVTLGSNVLRAETAALYCLATLRYEFEGAVR